MTALARPHGRAQSGAALLMAMIIVALVATLAAAMVWRQWRAVEVESAERGRTQADWILLGALDWARLILREDARANQTGQNVDDLGEIWAVPLAETRLSTFLTAGDGKTAASDDGPEAFLSGNITDAQGLYNLRNLLAGTVVPPLELRTLQRLCSQAGVSPDIATSLASQLRAAFATSGSASAGSSDDSDSAPLPPKTLAQLSWLGLDANTIAKLQPFVTLLPVVTPVNINTAPREVIASLFDNMDLASAQRIVAYRQSTPFTSTGAFKAQLPTEAQVSASADRFSVNSSYFIVEGRLRLDDRVLQERSLIQRSGLNMLVLSRERVAQVLDPAT